jgi:hypothetical protein
VVHPVHHPNFRSFSHGTNVTAPGRLSVFAIEQTPYDQLPYLGLPSPGLSSHDFSGTIIAYADP